MNAPNLEQSPLKKALQAERYNCSVGRQYPVDPLPAMKAHVIASGIIDCGKEGLCWPGGHGSREWCKSCSKVLEPNKK